MLGDLVGVQTMDKMIGQGFDQVLGQIVDQVFYFLWSGYWPHFGEGKKHKYLLRCPVLPGLKEKNMNNHKTNLNNKETP